MSPSKKRAVNANVSSPKAKGAGPRSHPHVITTPNMEYILELADIALGLKKPTRRTRLTNLRFTT